MEMKLGDRVTVTRVLKRMAEGNNKKYWQRRKIVHRQGLLIGIRTLSDGIRRWDGYEDGGWSYEAKDHFKAAMVVFSLKEKPVFVDLQDLILIEDDTDHEIATAKVSE